MKNAPFKAGVNRRTNVGLIFLNFKLIFKKDNAGGIKSSQVVNETKRLLGFI